MTAAALKLPSRSVQIPKPTIPLGDIGLQLWNATIREFDDWLPNDLAALNLACLAYQQVAEHAARLASGLTGKEKRQAEIALHHAATQHRNQMRELSLGTRPADSRPPRIQGRY